MKVKVHRTLYIFGESVHTERKRRVWHERKYRAFEFYLSEFTDGSGYRKAAYGYYLERRFSEASQ